MKYLGTVEETKRESIIFFIQATTISKSRRIPSVDYIIQIYPADASGVTRSRLFVIGCSSRQKNVHIIKGIYIRHCENRF